MSEQNLTIYPEGIRVFAPRPAAPEWVKGDIVITPNDLVAWLKANPQHLTDYQGKKQIRLSLLEGKSGLYVKLNNFTPEKKEDTPIPAEAQADSDGLPF